VSQTSWIYRFEAPASCCILRNAVVENKVALGSDLSRTTAAYTIWAVISLLPSIYDYAGAHNAVNPALYDRVWSTNLFFSQENPLFNNLEFLQEEFMRKLSTAFGTIPTFLFLPPHNFLNGHKSRSGRKAAVFASIGQDEFSARGRLAGL
jgi:hypothetical protein